MPREEDPSDQNLRNLTRFAPSSRMARFLIERNGRMFFTRDCLNFGPRAAIDKFLSKAVKTGRLLRLARGCFIENRPGVKIPSKDEIAFGKAKAFGKQLYAHGINSLKEFFDFKHSASANSYATNGATSSFMSCHGRIHMKAYAQRKLTLADRPVGQAVRALWHFKCRFYATELWPKLFERLGRTERDLIRNVGNLIPWWMVDIVKYGVRFRSEAVTAEQQDLLDSLKPRPRQADTGETR